MFTEEDWVKEGFNDKHKDYLYKHIMQVQSADVRARAISEIYPGGAANFFTDLVKRGKGKLVLEPVDENDYQYGRLWEVILDGVSTYKLELINQTPEPDSEGLTEQECLDRGYTKEGHKIVFLGVPADRTYETIWQAWFWGFGDERNCKTPEEFCEIHGFDFRDVIFVEA